MPHLRRFLCTAIRQNHRAPRGFFVAHFLLRIFPLRLGPESDRQAMCNLLLHMQQKVVIGLVAALPRCASPRLGVKKFSRGCQLDKTSLHLLNRPVVKCLFKTGKIIRLEKHQIRVAFVGPGPDQSGIRSGARGHFRSGFTLPAADRRHPGRCLALLPEQLVQRGPPDLRAESRWHAHLGLQLVQNRSGADQPQRD